jgi:adenylate kinase family enzyme
MIERRVVVLGTSGSGKTTLARKIATQLNVRHIELDVLYWNAGWTPTPMPEFLQKIRVTIAESESWVICGNYNVAKQITLPKATDIVWLDYPIYVNLWRAFIRSVKRILNKEESFTGCKETVAHLLFSKESILLWILQTHSRRRKEFEILLTKENFPNANIFRVKNEKESSMVLASMQ